MLRQSSSRIHRSRGSKVKNVLQVCFLVAVSLWLIYQVKHSHDKRKEFDETDATAQVQVQNTRLGRRDLPPLLEETSKNSNPKHDEEDEAEEEDDNKHDDEQDIEQDGNNSSEEREDAIREHGREKPDTDDDGEDILEEEKKREENSFQGGSVEDGEKEKASSSEGRDGNFGSRSAHEAREKLYKADDASSAVTQDIDATSNKTENRNLEDLTGKTEIDSLQEEKEKENQVKTVQEEKGEIAENGIFPIVTEKGDNANGIEEEKEKENQVKTAQEEKGEIAENGIFPNVTEKGDNANATISSKSEENLLLNSTAKQEAPESRNNSTEGGLLSDNLSLLNETDTKLDMNGAQNVTSDVASSTTLDGQSSGAESISNQSDSNLASSAEAVIQNPVNATISEFAEPEKVKPVNGSRELESQIEKPEIQNGTYDSSGSFHAGNADALQREQVESTNSSIRLEDKNPQEDVNLGTLPAINSEGDKKDDPKAVE